MAEFTYSGLGELMLDLQSIAEIPDAVQDEMLNEQADVVVKAQQERARMMGVEDTGLTIRAIKKGKVKIKKDGSRVIYIYPSGTRGRGEKRIRNAEIGFINEFGKKGQKARPFVRTANEKSAEATTQAAADVYDRFLKSKNL